MSEIAEDQQDSFRNSFEEEHLQEYLEHVARTLEISNAKYRIKLSSKAGDNYVAVVYRIFIEGDKNGMPVNVQTIFKVPPKDETMRRVLRIGHFFPREHVFYSEIVPVFKEFLKEKNQSLENIAECYLSSSDDHKEVICLEDLRAKGFVMRDRIKQLDFAHISLALRALGRLHALSFALRDQRPDIFISKITTLTEVMCGPELYPKVGLITYFSDFGDLVKTALADEDPMYTGRFSEYMKNGSKSMKWSCDGTIAEPYAVLCHGDFWMNNMLFKYDQDSSAPKDLYLLDFQLACYASPAVDISYVLFCNCSQEVREKHYDELIEIYHESLSAYLSELGSDPKKLFPYEALVAQLEKFSIYGDGMAILVLPSLTSQGKDVIRVDLEHDAMPAMRKRIHRDHFWRNTTRDTFKDLIDRNYI